MTVRFLNNDLQELYETGYSRKYRNVPKNIVEKKLLFAVKMLLSADNIQDIWQNNGLRFEHLVNTDKYSLRLDIRWRLEMKIDWTNKDCTIGIIGLTDLTKHYGD